VTVVRDGRKALDGISLRVDQGENVAVLGPNGSGKSTLVHTIARDLYPFAGEGHVRVFGQDRWNLFDLRKLVGIISADLQAECLKDCTGLDMVVSGLFGAYGLNPLLKTEPWMFDKALALLEFLDAARLAERRVNRMSSGEARRVIIGRALICEPKALILDEPTTSLDIVSAGRFLETLAKVASSGVDLVLVTHHIEEVLPSFHRVVMLKEGRVFFDGPRDEALTEARVSELYGAPVRLEQGVSGLHARLEEL